VEGGSGVSLLERHGRIAQEKGGEGLSLREGFDFFKDKRSQSLKALNSCCQALKKVHVW